MSSGSSTVRQALEAFVAGRAGGDRTVAAVAEHYYRGANPADRRTLAPLIAIIEQAAPGIVELARSESGAGFSIRLAERRFPAAFEDPLRAEATAVLATDWGRGEGAAIPVEADRTGFLARIVRAVRRFFSASA